MASVGKVPMGLKVAHGTPRSVIGGDVDVPEEVHVGDDDGVRRESSLMSLSCPGRPAGRISASSKAASSTRQASAAAAVERPLSWQAYSQAQEMERSCIWAKLDQRDYE